MLDNGYDFEAQREQLIQLIREKGVRDERVLEAVRRVPRHLMVPEEYRWQAYIDHALPIGEGQTISQPSLVATMTELLELRGDERVLEIGTGSGYQAAILTLLCRQLVTVERFPRLALRAYHILTALRFPPFVLVMGDGTRGSHPLRPMTALLSRRARRAECHHPCWSNSPPTKGDCSCPSARARTRC